VKQFNLFGLIVLVLCLLLAITPQLQAQEPDAKFDKPTPTPTPGHSPLTPQIVGGTLASPGEYPWQAALVTASQANPYNGQFCGGSLIAEEWVLTAAHCVVDFGIVTDPADIDVVLGITTLSSGPTNGSTGQRRDVAQVIPYPGYNEGTFDGDIALLRLASPVTLNSSVGIIGLVEPANAALAAPNVTAVVTGWGNTLGQPNPGGTSFPDNLYEVSVPIVSNTTCNAPASYSGAITGNMFCAGLIAGGKDSCQGDSGGPLVVPNGSGGWLQAGVVSWGDGCAQPNLYGVYSRVWNFTGWIDLQINGAAATVYLPMVMKNYGAVVSCTPSPPGESNNVLDALTVCSGQTVYGQVNDSDLDDVYKISAAANQILTLSMSGTGIGGSGDADLYLYPPGTVNVITDPFYARSIGYGNNEFIQVTLPQNGLWYIDIYDFTNGDGGTNYALSINLSGP
jgi:secreted trypsin-like serine protease